MKKILPLLFFAALFAALDVVQAQSEYHPNPTDGLLTVELSNGTGIANAVLYDLQGRIVETCHGASLQGATATLSLNSVPAGVYVLRVTDTEGREYHQKIVKK